MQPSVRFSLDDVVELPEWSQQVIDVDMTDEQPSVYKAVASQMQSAELDQVAVDVIDGKGQTLRATGSRSGALR